MQSTSAAAIRKPQQEGATQFSSTLACQPWPLDKKHSADEYCRSAPAWVQQTIEQISWPQQPVIFICDLHADADALFDSLHLCGATNVSELTPPHLHLTPFAKQSTIVIGGDCLDKGPCNLSLLRAVKALIDAGAQLELLAGNHDMRLWMGLQALALEKHVKTEHMFLRMGEKVIPLFREIYDQYLLSQRKAKLSLPSLSECREILYPRDDWFEQFPVAVDGLLSKAAIRRELKRMRRKYTNFESSCAEAGMDLQDIYMVAKQCQTLFLDECGEFGWFFKRMKLAYQTGSILYLHAGLDDQVASLMAEHGVDELNQRFQSQIHQNLFDFYYGEVANVVRTKYRKSDLKLSREGAKRLQEANIDLIVHGHVNRHRGQRLSQHQGVLHIESDVTLDRYSRQQEGLAGTGAGATVILPEQEIIALSRDLTYAKVLSSQFHPKDQRC